MKRHLLLLPVILGFMISVYATIESRSQEKWEYPRQEMKFSINSEKIDQDSVLVLFSTRGLLGLLKEYQAYCDTSTMSVEGLMNWLENVKLKGIVHE